MVEAGLPYGPCLRDSFSYKNVHSLHFCCCIMLVDEQGWATSEPRPITWSVFSSDRSSWKVLVTLRRPRERDGENSSSNGVIIPNACEIKNNLRTFAFRQNACL